MVKKLFVLASVTALTGLIAATLGAGCSSPDAAPEAPVVSAPDGAPPVKPPPGDSGGDGPDETTCPRTKPVAEAEVQAVFKWLPPAAVQTACTQQNLDDLKALFTKGKGSAKFTDIKTSLGATCSACAFSKTASTSWQVIIEDTNGYLDNGTASCFAQLDSAACGKAAFQFDTCLQIACPDTECGTAAAVTACNSKAAKGACKGMNTAVSAACPKLQEDVATCGGILDAIAISCAGGPDAGIDASTVTYGFVLRHITRLAAWRSGGPTDTSRVHELTDWRSVDDFAARFLDLLDVPRVTDESGTHPIPGRSTMSAAEK